MAEYISGQTSMSGLGSDVDFNDLLQKLYKVESRHAMQLLTWKKDWQERRDAFSEIRKELKEFRTKIGKLNSIEKFLSKSITSSKDTVATATAKTETKKATHKVEVKRLATASSWSLETGVQNKNESLNNSDTPGVFKYTYKGQQYSISIPKGTTLEGLKNMINGNSAQSGVQANLIQSGDGLVFQLQGKDTGKNAVLTIDQITNVDGMSIEPAPLKWQAITTGSGASHILSTSFPNDSYVINADSYTQKFVYNYDGVDISVNVPPGMTLSQLRDAINTKTPGVATLYPEDQLISGGDPNRRFFALTTNQTAHTISNVSQSLQDLVGTDVTPGTPVAAGTYTFTVDQGKAFEKKISITLGDGATIDTLMTEINNVSGGSGIASIDGNGKLALNTNPTYTTLAIATTKGECPVMDAEYQKAQNWTVNFGQDALIRVDDWPVGGYLSKSSNTIDDVTEGVTYNLRDVGQAVITIGYNEKEIKKNVLEFIESVNSFRTLINSLTKTDEDKKVLEPGIAESQSQMQKGATLTGNYGILLISSRLKNAISDQGKGFMHYDEQTNRGDIFASLSQLGIMTNSDQASPNFGLLELKDKTDAKGMSFDDALKKDPYAVAMLFAANSIAHAESVHFGHNSHVENLTKPGRYEVSYIVDANGEITSAIINGKTATINQVTKQIGLSSSTAPPNDADGIYLDIYDLDHNNGVPKTGNISIKSGKINELIGMFDGEEGILATKKGPLGILENNYKEIMKNIDKKVKSEDERLTKWTRMMKQRFAKLEGILAVYKEKTNALQAQVKQLSPSK